MSFFVQLVSGPLSPDCAGTYVFAGIVNGKSSYERDDGAFGLYWYDGTSGWLLEDLPSHTAVWSRVAESEFGEYPPTGGVATGTAEFVYVDESITGSGGIVLGGTSTPSAQYAPTATGGVVLGGAATPAASYPLTASGGIELGGVAPNGYRYTETPSGGITLGGEATRGFSCVISGGATLGGSATVAVTYSPTATGGITLSGTVTPNTWAETSTGGIALGGAADWHYIASTTPAGGITLGGSATVGTERTYRLDLRGLYRVWAAPEYRLYRAEDAPPLETDTPYATSASLPATPADTFADGDWYVSVSYFNGVLDSGFLPLNERGETYRRLTVVDGEAQDAPPQGPADWLLRSEDAGVVRVEAFYLETGDARATAWAIAYTVDGSTPAAGDPDVTVTMQGTTGAEILSYALPAQADGVTLKVRLQTVRGTSYSEGSTVKTVVVDAAGPTAALAADAWPGQLVSEE